MTSSARWASRSPPSIGLDDPFDPRQKEEAPNGWEWVNRVPEDFQAFGDRAQLYRVIDNLGRNAIEAGATTVVLSAETEPRRRVPGERFVLNISDNGPGIPDRVSENLFKPFSVSMRKGGSGLGLSLSRELVQLHGGDLNLTRNGPKGCTFRFSIPMP